MKCELRWNNLLLIAVRWEIEFAFCLPLFWVWRLSLHINKVLRYNCRQLSNKLPPWRCSAASFKLYTLVMDKLKAPFSFIILTNTLTPCSRIIIISESCYFIYRTKIKLTLRTKSNKIICKSLSIYSPKFIMLCRPFIKVKFSTKKLKQFKKEKITANEKNIRKCKRKRVFDYWKKRWKETAKVCCRSEKKKRTISAMEDTARETSFCRGNIYGA